MIQTLRRGDAIPDGTPGRYLSSNGYVRLRWRIGTEEYVECYEHRLVMGLPDAHVHHRDGDKENNDPSNLEVLTIDDHQRVHAKLRVRRRLEAGRLTVLEKRKLDRAIRREERERWWAQVAAEHAAGASSVELGRKYGKDHTSICRGLHQRGYEVTRRPGGFPPGRGHTNSGRGR